MLAPDSGSPWAMSVVFLVFTLRAILYKPFVKQIRTTRKMQEIQPQMQAIRKKYGKDRVKMTEEMQKLQKEHGFNPLLGCLPMLAQIPVFIGLFHVLRSFNRMGTGFGQLGMTAEETRNTANYIFSPELVQNFLDARLFGVPLSAAISQPETEWVAFSPTGVVDFTRANIIWLVIPLVIVSSIATHMNSRASVARQSEAAAGEPADADHEQPRALRLPPGHPGVRCLLPRRDPPVLGLEQPLDLRSAAPRLRTIAKEEEEKREAALAAGTRMRPSRAPGPTKRRRRRAP